MDLRQHMSRWNGKMTKEKWLFLLFIGGVLMILAFPSGREGNGGLAVFSKQKGGGTEVSNIKGADDGSALSGQIPSASLSAQNSAKGSGSGGGGNGGSGGSGAVPGSAGTGGNDSETGGGAAGEADVSGDAAYASAKAAGESDYEAQMEARVKEILRHVDGVGQVDVMIVLKSSEEKVLRVDRNTSVSDTEEQDSQGGTRSSKSNQTQESTVLSGGGSGQGSAPFVEKELRPEISGIVISAAGGGSPTVKAEISAAMEALFGLPPHKIKVLKRVE
ncbi:MAG: stage III sporulation protein AG [Enterocloster asparagiformis]|nr:stage III sporulation protein AG [Enterocloster asparagiformis]